jgi:hypothetical protein
MNPVEHLSLQGTSERPGRSSRKTLSELSLAQAKPYCALDGGILKAAVKPFRPEPGPSFSDCGPVVVTPGYPLSDWRSAIT